MRVKSSMENAVVTFVNPDSENTKIQLTFEYDREKKTLNWNSTFEKESDEKLDFIGYLAAIFINTLSHQGEVQAEEDTMVHEDATVDPEASVEDTSVREVTLE